MPHPVPAVPVPHPTTSAPGWRPAGVVPDELVEAAMSGDRIAVERLLAAIRPAVERYCRSRLGPGDRLFLSVDDIAQEVCLAVLNGLSGYRAEGHAFLAFVHRIAAHKVVDAYRAAARSRTEPVAAVPDAVDADAEPEQHVLRAELAQGLRLLLDQLDAPQRDVLLLRVVVGLSSQETAAILGTTPGAVRVIQHRALNRLRRGAPASLLDRMVA